MNVGVRKVAALDVDHRQPVVRAGQVDVAGDRVLPGLAGGVQVAGLFGPQSLLRRV